MSGVQRKTLDLATRHWDYKGRRTKGGRLDDKVVADFRADSEGMLAVADEIKSLLENRETFEPRAGDIDSEWPEVREGRALFARHLRREGNGALRDRKLAKIKAAGLPIACEVCGFDYGITYGNRGLDSIDVHHVLPLHVSGETATRTADLLSSVPIATG